MTPGALPLKLALFLPLGRLQLFPPLGRRLGQVARSAGGSRSPEQAAAQLPALGSGGKQPLFFDAFKARSEAP